MQRAPSTFRLAALAAVCTWSAFAQDEQALRRYFEGREVRVKYDLPATHEGVDVFWRKDPPVDLDVYSQRIKNFGIALRQGDTVRVTAVRVKQKNIEFQLGGGGYGTFGDDTGHVSPRSVPKTTREKELESDIKSETNGLRRGNMRAELRRLQAERRREEAHERDRAAELQAVKTAEIARKRLEAGSRINLWFPPKYLAEQIPIPNELMAMLAEYLEFSSFAARP